MRTCMALLLAALAAPAAGAGAAPAARKASAPLNLLAVAKGAPPPPAWKGGVPRPAWKTALRAGRKIKGNRFGRALGGDPSDITGAVGNKTSKPKPAAPETDPAQFCSNVADAAIDARLAWQMKELEKTESVLRDRIAELEAKRAEYEQWLKLRDDFLKKAEDNVIAIYTRMRPEAAAVQIASMTDDTAAAVLAKLNPRSASAIFNEMEPARAAHLANTLGGMRRTNTGKAAAK